jgi:anaerobic selenocysteine-containing dehydrogenase
MQGSPALTGLVEPLTISLNHVDLERIGVESGAEVSVTGANGSVVMTVVLDETVPRGVCEVPFGVEKLSDENSLRSIIDASQVINQVRLETR